MKIGCPSEIKNNEFRVGLTPAAARAYIENGHQVMVQKGAGVGSALGIRSMNMLEPPWSTRLRPSGIRPK